MISSAVLKNLGVKALRFPAGYTTAAGATGSAARITESITNECPEQSYTATTKPRPSITNECPEQSYAATTKPRPFSEIPGPRSFPIIGTQWMYYPGGPLYGLKVKEVFPKLREMYGDIIRDNVVPGFFSVTHIFNPEDVETLFRNEGKYPIRDSFFMLKKYNKKYNNNVSGIVATQGEEWYNMRTNVQKIITNPKNIRSYTDTQHSVAVDFISLIRKLRDDDDVIEDILPYIYRYSTEAIGVVCFNQRIGSLDENMAPDSESQQFIKAVTDFMTATHQETSSFLYLYFDTPLFRKFKRAQDTIRSITLKYARAELERTKNVAEGDDVKQVNMLRHLMTKTSLTEPQIITFLSECFFAGVDTTSLFLGYTLYNLCKHPDVMERLRAEINEFLPDHSPVTAEALDKMSYLRAVLKESVRLNPVTGGNGRTTSKEIILSGYKIPPGTYIGIHTSYIAQLEEYVDDASSFRPERWMRNVDLKLCPFTYLPFGFGARTCLGKRLSEQEVSLAIIKILQNFDVEYRHDVEIDYKTRVMNVPCTPLKFKFTDL